jgi:hypothetical protein
MPAVVRPARPSRPSVTPAAGSPPGARSRPGNGPQTPDRPRPDSPGLPRGARSTAPAADGARSAGAPPGVRSPAGGSRASGGADRPASKQPASRSTCSRATGARPGWKSKPAEAKPEPKILFQSYFKSIGPRTYAAQVKEAANRNQFLVLTEGKRDPKTDEVRKTSVYVYSEDFGAFFRLIKQAAEWIKANPLPQEIKQQRDAFWRRQKQRQDNPGK